LTNQTSGVERLNSCFTADGESCPGLVFLLGEQRHEVLAVVARAERLAEASEELFAADAPAARVGLGGGAAEAGRAENLAHEQRLESNAELELARDAVRVAGHQPDHALGARVAAGEWRAFDRGPAR